MHRCDGTSAVIYRLTLGEGLLPLSQGALPFHEPLLLLQYDLLAVGQEIALLLHDLDLGQKFLPLGGEGLDHLLQVRLLGQQTLFHLGDTVPGIA